MHRPRPRGIGQERRRASALLALSALLLAGGCATAPLDEELAEDFSTLEPCQGDTMQRCLREQMRRDLSKTTLTPAQQKAILQRQEQLIERSLSGSGELIRTEEDKKARPAPLTGPEPEEVPAEEIIPMPQPEAVEAPPADLGREPITVPDLPGTLTPAEEERFLKELQALNPGHPLQMPEGQPGEDLLEPPWMEQSPRTGEPAPAVP
jgi:hypothetical protein